jgi:Zn-dependent protease
MRSGFRFGRILGIDIRVDWRWLFILFLATWNLRTVFEQSHRDWGLIAMWGTAVIAALVFFVSVSAHKLAPSLVASGRGIPVRNITLYLFGGVSNIRRARRAAPPPRYCQMAPDARRAVQGLRRLSGRRE